MEATWSDYSLPEVLENPASWLPPTAWADQRIGGYVARRYAACVPPNELARLPGNARDLILAERHEPGRDQWFGIGQDTWCYLVPTEVARDIAATLEAAGVHLEEGYSSLMSWDRHIFILYATPDGDGPCLCG